MIKRIVKKINGKKYIINIPTNDLLNYDLPIDSSGQEFTQRITESNLELMIITTENGLIRIIE